MFTDFLPSLNTGSCFVGQCDWRLPTREELLTIASPTWPACTVGPCIDPIFGPTATFGRYWSGTTDATLPSRAWFVVSGNGNGFVHLQVKVADSARAARTQF